MSKRIILSLALSLGIASIAPAALANNGNNSHSGSYSQTGGQNQAGGIYGNASGGYDVTTGTGTGWGSSASDAAGGNGTTSGVVNNGWSKQFSTGYDHSAASSATDLGLGYANTATSGDNTSYNFSVGHTYGPGSTGTANGAAGGDFSSEAHGSYQVNYQGAQGDIYGQITLGTWNAYGEYGAYQQTGHGYGYGGE